MTNELPVGWTQCRVEELFNSFSGGTPSKDKDAYWGGTIPWLSSGDIKADRITAGSEFITRAGLENSSSKLCRPGSVLVVVRSGILKHTLPVSVLAREAAINQDIKCFDSGRDDLNGWLALALRTFSKDVLALNREGTTVQSVRYETLQHFQLPIPPVAEQKRIAERLEKLLAEVEQCKGRMAKIPVLLKRFRQSVLAAACSGRLTESWRNAERIEPEGMDLLRDICSDRKLPIESVTMDPQFEVPESWGWAKLDSLLRDDNGLAYGVLKPGSYVPRGVPMLRVMDIGFGKLNETHIFHISPELSEEFRRTRLEPGDVLLAVMATVGRSMVVPPRLTGANVNRAIAVIKLSQRISPEYIWAVISSPFFQDRFAYEKVGSAQQRINLTDLREFIFPIPPITEQAEIVRRIDVFFALADKIETRFNDVKRRVDGLGQSILAKAFHGELVPTEAELAAREGRTYESAAQLLERVRAVRNEPVTDRRNGTARTRRHVQ